MKEMIKGYDDFSIIERVEVGDRVKVRIRDRAAVGCTYTEDEGTVTKIYNGVWMQVGEESMDQVYVVFVMCDHTSNRPIAFNPKDIKPIDC